MSGLAWCKQCGVKRGQHPRWLCRGCDVAAGTYTPAVHAASICRRCGHAGRTREALCSECWGAIDAALGDAAAPGRPAPALAPVRERTIGGWVFAVVWDGTRGSLTGWPSRES
jgi:predicted amidophosphoribosyltransferase